MENLNRFYTYAYLREDRTPYYIGKGRGDRIYCKQRKIKPPKDKSRIIFLKQNLTEEEAFKHEIYMISVFGRIDLGTGILHNRTDGGDGCSGFKHSEETKIKYSEMRKGTKHPNYDKIYAEEYKKKQSELKKGKNNPNYGKKWWNDGNGNDKMSVECPGPNWVVGRSEDHKEKMSSLNKGKKWWNDGCGNMKHSIECPGDGWILGTSEERKIKNSKINKGKKWWNDGNGNYKMSEECPGEGWFPGKKFRDT